MWANNLTSWAKIVKRKNRGKCIICGLPATQAHHVCSRAKNPQLALLVENGVPLCNSCHGVMRKYRSAESYSQAIFRAKLMKLSQKVGVVKSNRRHPRVIKVIYPRLQVLERWRNGEDNWEENNSQEG
jgi:hypothetical protein